MAHQETVEEFIDKYPFLKYIREDKSQYIRAKDRGYIDPNDLFMIGESGGFLMDIREGDKFVNIDLLIEAAANYKADKKYTNFKVDSIPHRQFRKREQYRRKHGFSAPCFMRDGEIRDLWISGSMYNYLNYTLIEQLDEKSVKHTRNGDVGRKHYDFPKFIDAQFWTFMCMQFARDNGFHMIIDKTRRGGFSYIMASDSANNINLNARKTEIHVAVDKKYLTAKGGLTDFTLSNLRFYETKTPFVRGILTSNKENFTLGFKLPDGTVSPKSWNSAIFSVSAQNNPDCAIGKDAMDVKVEEVSTMDNFDPFMTVTEPAMRTGSYLTGNLFCWGTATSGNMQIFNRNFYAPRNYHFMPFENVWDKDQRGSVCGYFKPYAWGLQGEINGEKAMDENGNSNLELGLRIAFKEREKKKKEAKTFADYINYLGQYALMPSESFSSAIENIFSSEELLDWEIQLQINNDYNFYVDGMLYEKDNNEIEFKSNARIEAEGGKYNQDFFKYIEGVPRKQEEHPHGCIRKWFNPMKVKYTNKKGVELFGVPEGMYSISYDPVGVNKDKNEITMKHSHNSIMVWMNPCKWNNFRTAMVCCYYGRPDKLEEADKICLLLAKYYNCIGTVGVEVNRGETVSNFTKWKALKYLMTDPVDLWDTSIKGKVVGAYGINMGTEQKKLEGLRFLKEMLYSTIYQDETGRDVKLFETIFDYQTIVELKQWNNIGNFDRVSQMIIRAIQWRYNNVQAAKELETKKQLVDKDKKNILKRSWF